MSSGKPLTVEGLAETARELKKWIESAQGRRELAEMMDKARAAEKELATDRLVDLDDLHRPFTL